MKKIVALLLGLLLIVGIMVGAFAARDPKTCSHEWGYVGKKDGGDGQGYNSFWVPSCPGHPWGHYHHQTYYFDTLYYNCKYGCGASKTEIKVTHRDPEICQYSDNG